jgi:3-hydroxyisobutyrate dehydrogenase
VKQRVAVLGLGTMGAGMAQNLLKAGFPVIVYNRTRAKSEPFAALGASVVATAAEAAQNADIVLSMLADDQASRSAWSGSDGALANMRPGAVAIESSTVSPAWIEELAGLAAQRGIDFLDAPVTGSRMQAEGAQLLFLVGGSEEVLAATTDVLKAMSRDIVHLGPVGSGSKMKLINNFLSGVQVASLAEGLAWIERSGIDIEKALHVLKNGAPGSPLFSAISGRMVNHDYAVNFLLNLMAKDLRYAQTEASRYDVNLRTAEAAGDLFAAAIEKGFGQDDMAAVIEPLRNT